MDAKTRVEYQRRNGGHYDVADKEKKDNILKRIGRYFKTLFLEMKKVNWPTRRQLVTGTFSVIVYCLLVGAVIAVLDLVVGDILLSGLLGLRDPGPLGRLLGNILPWVFG